VNSVPVPGFPTRVRGGGGGAGGEKAKSEKSE